MKHYALRWKLFFVLLLYFMISPILHGIYNAVHLINLLLISGINIIYGLLGWFLLGILLTRKSALEAVPVLIWLFPLIILAIFVLRYDYQNSGTPLLLYVSASFSHLEFQKNPGLKTDLSRGWHWIGIVLSFMLLLDMLIMKTTGFNISLQ